MLRTSTAALLLGAGLAARGGPPPSCSRSRASPWSRARRPHGRRWPWLDPTFAGIEDLQKPETLRNADLLVLPYGSAFPADAWGAIRSYLERGGNLLNVGGRPLWIPAFREGTGFRLGRAADDYWRLLAAVDATEVPRRDGKPFLVVGVNHWVNDAVFPYFPENGNALEWDRDFAEMASRDLNFVRTGTGSTGSSSSTGPPAARARRCCATSRRSSSPPLATACTCSSRSSRSSLGA